MNLDKDMKRKQSSASSHQKVISYTKQLKIQIQQRQDVRRSARLINKVLHAKQSLQKRSNSLNRAQVHRGSVIQKSQTNENIQSRTLAAKKIQRMPILQEKNPNNTFQAMTPEQKERMSLEINQFNPQSFPIELKKSINQPKITSHTIEFNKLLASITVRNRFKILSWASCFFSKLNYTRKALALGSYIFDLYIQYVKPNVQDLQLIAVSAITIAHKFQHNCYFPKIKGIFSWEEILAKEEDIIKSLNFRLYFKTYIAFIEEMIVEWNIISQQPRIMSQEQSAIMGNLAYFFDDHERKAKIVTLYDKLEIINSIAFSLKYRIQDICLNLLFMDTYRSKQWLTHKNVNLQWCTTVQQLKCYQDHQHIIRFKNLCRETKEKYNFSGQLSQEIGRFLIPFMRLKVNQKIKQFGEQSCRVAIGILNHNLKAYQETKKHWVTR